MKKCLLLIISLVLLMGAEAQMKKKSPEEAIRFLADHTLAEVDYALMNFATGEVYSESNKLPLSENIKVKNKLTDWHYENGVMNMAMLHLGNVLNEDKYTNFVKHNYTFVNEHYDYFKKQFEDSSIMKPSFRQLYAFKYLDNCGTMGAALLQMMNEENLDNEKWSAIIEKTADYIMNDEFRLDDGTLSREYPRKGAVWADDLYMSVAFLARMGHYSKESKYFDFAITQVLNYTHYLRNEQLKVYNHAYFHHQKMTNGAYWGRANGWVMMAQVELLSYLPDDHPQKDELVSVLTQFIQGVSHLQSQNGLWHQLLNKEDSFLESSCTAMFIYSIARAVNQGWIDSAFSQVAWKGWQGLYTNITEDAQVKDICVGTHIEWNLPFYYNRPISVNDTHGLAATLMAGAEIVKMQTTYGPQIKPSNF